LSTTEFKEYIIDVELINDKPEKVFEKGVSAVADGRLSKMETEEDSTSAGSGYSH
jgi:hypothetical protein